MKSINQKKREEFIQSRIICEKIKVNKLMFYFLYNLIIKISMKKAVKL